MAAQTPGTSQWYAVAVTERGVVKAMVLTAAEWNADQASGVDAPNFENIGSPDGYPTRAAAQKAVNAFNGQSNASKLSQAGVTTAPDVPNPLTGVAAIGDFFSRLTQASTWVRVGEVAVGLILLGIGLNSLLKGKPMQVVTGAAGLASKVVPA